jgi:uncharacterized membrane protein YbhN (UPF0104 family)
MLNWLRRTPMRARLHVAAGYLVAAACLVWVFHDVDARPMLEAARRLEWRLVALGIAVDLCAYFLQGLRWKLLLRPVGPISWSRAAQAIYAGLFTNGVLPMRAGEVVRAYVVSRRMQAPVSAVFPSVVVERLFDGAWLTAAVGITAALLPLPHPFRMAGDLLGVLIVGAAVLFLYEVLREPPPPRPAHGHHPALHTPHWLTRFRQGFQLIGRRRSTYLALGLSLVVLAGQALAFWLVMRGYGFEFGFLKGAAVLVIVTLGTTIPTAPANIGTYQFACVVGLTLLGVDKTQASGFSLVVFAVLTIPLLVAGALAFARSGASLESSQRR